MPTRLAPILFLILLMLGLALPATGQAMFTPTRFDDPPPGTCDPGDCSLREAVIAANASPGADTIVLSAGTYTLTIPGAFENDAMAGDLDARDDVTITGPGAALTTVNGNGAVTGIRTFHIDPVSDATSVVVTLSGFTITGGVGSFGAGVYSENEARTTVTDMVVTGNSGNGFGGGLFNEDDAQLTVVRTTISDNETDGYGGAIGNQNQGRLTIIGSTISGNRTGGNFSGAVFNQNQGVLAMENTTVSGNTSEGRGGGFFIQNNSVTTITNSTVSANSTQTNGGGLFVQNDATVTLLNTTVTGNTADSDATGDGDGGGLFTDLVPPGVVALKNSIVAGNVDPTSDPDCFGTLASHGYNLIGIVSAGCTFAGTTADATGTPAAPIDPRLGPLADNGGLTQTHALLAGSPAIDAAGPGAPPTDQRGAPRTGPPDKGAYELRFCQKVAVNRIGTEGNDVLLGTNGADGILGFGGKDRIEGLGGNDGVCAGPGKDRALGGGGKDRIRGDAAKDILKGGGGRDRLNGGPGKDTCIGQGGKDKAKACEKEKSIP